MTTLPPLTPTTNYIELEKIENLNLKKLEYEVNRTLETKARSISADPDHETDPDKDPDPYMRF